MMPLQIKTLISDLNGLGFHARFIQRKSISLLYVKHRNNAAQVIKLVTNNIEGARTTVINNDTVIFNLR